MGKQDSTVVTVSRTQCRLFPRFNASLSRDSLMSD